MRYNASVVAKSSTSLNWLK